MALFTPFKQRLIVMLMAYGLPTAIALSFPTLVPLKTNATPVAYLHDKVRMTRQECLTKATTVLHQQGLRILRPLQQYGQVVVRGRSAHLSATINCARFPQHERKTGRLVVKVQGNDFRQASQLAGALIGQH